MTTAAFLEVYRSFWPSARDLDGEGYQALWRHVVEFLPDEGVLMALRHLRSTKPFPPTIAAFQEWADTRAEAWALRQVMGARRGDPAADGKNGAAWLARFRPIPCPGDCGMRWADDEEGRHGAARHSCAKLADLQRQARAVAPPLALALRRIGTPPPRPRPRRLTRAEIPDLDGGVSAGGA